MLAYLFVIFAVLMRMPFMPHPWGFTPVAAALLYFGARGSRRQLWVPFALLAASDVILTKFVHSYVFSWDHFVTWAWYAAILFLGSQLRENTGWLRVAGAARGGAPGRPRTVQRAGVRAGQATRQGCSQRVARYRPQAQMDTMFDLAQAHSLMRRELMAALA